MKVYLVRHGQACPPEENPERPLTEEGGRQARTVAAFLKPLGLRVAEIRHSGKARARQTAEILAEVVQAEGGARQVGGLDPNDKAKPVAKELAALSGDLMIVGHMPYLGKLASALLGCPKSAQPVAFSELTTVCLESAEGGPWHILWAVNPDVLASA